MTEEEKKVAAAKKVAEKKAEEEKNKEETVTISKNVLENILTQLDDLKQGQKEFEQTASQDQVRKIEALRASGKLVKSIKIAMIEGDLVKNWKSTVDEVYIDHALGKEVSRQMTKLSFFNGKNKEMSQIDFARRKTYQEFEVIKEGRDKEGEIILTVLGTDGQELDINSRYVN